MKENPYLGVTLKDNLHWSSQINNISKKASQQLGFIRRNLRHCNQHFKETAYIVLVCSLLEYSCTVWDPHLQHEIQQIEAIQRKAARFVKADYSRYSSVSQMMAELGWKPLHTRRREQRLTMMFKIINNLVAIPPN